MHASNKTIFIVFTLSIILACKQNHQHDTDALDLAEFNKITEEQQFIQSIAKEYDSIAKNSSDSIKLTTLKLKMENKLNEKFPIGTFLNIYPHSFGITQTDPADSSIFGFTLNFEDQFAEYHYERNFETSLMRCTDTVVVWSELLKEKYWNNLPLLRIKIETLFKINEFDHPYLISVGIIPNTTKQ